MDMSVDEQLKEANFELYLTNLQNFVYDDEKIVTYKWLSNELSISVNLSKELLIQFVADQKSSNTESISVVYLIYGDVEDGFKFHLVRDTDLSKVRKQFKNVINEQIFSVQRQANVGDLNILYTVDKYLGKDCIGKIGFDYDIVRKETKKIHHEIKKELPSNNDLKSKTVEKKSGISNMFQNQIKKNVQNENIEVERKNSKNVPIQKSPETKTKSTKQSTKGGIANFFNKQSKLSEKSTSLNTKDQIPVKENKSVMHSSTLKQEMEICKAKEQTGPKNDYRDILDSDSDDDLGFNTKVENVVEEEIKPIKSKDVGKSQTKRRRTAKDKDGNNPKRRKRIVQQDNDSESSDDDIFAKDCSKSPAAVNKKLQISDNEDVEEVPPTPVSHHDLKKKRIGRQIDKTYLDNEGFFVTKKEFVVETESDTDNETEIISKNENVFKNMNNLSNLTVQKMESVDKNKVETKIKNDAKKKVSPKKQATLTNFFKKK